MELEEETYQGERNDLMVQNKNGRKIYLLNCHVARKESIVYGINISSCQSWNAFIRKYILHVCYNQYFMIYGIKCLALQVLANLKKFTRTVKIIRRQLNKLLC